MSEAKTLTTLYPVPFELPLAARRGGAGRLKLRKKAELQAWLDGLPEPNERVKADLAKHDRKTWPLSVAGDLALYAQVDFAARQKFLMVSLAPFNPGLSADELAKLIDELDSEEEFLAILKAAYGRNPHEVDDDDPKSSGDGQ